MFKRLNYSEPAVLKGIFTALAALATAVGFTNAADIEGAGEALIPAVSFLLPLAQAWWTRRSVVPVEKHKDQIARAAGHVVIPQTPGVADHAAPEA